MNRNTINNYKIDEIPLTDLDYAGVVYEHTDRNIKTSKNMSYPYIKKKKIKKAQNFNFNTFLGITISIGIIVFSLVFFLTYSFVSNYFGTPKTFGSKSNLSEVNSINSNSNIDILNSNTEENLIGIIKEIDYENGRFNIMNFSTNKTYNLKSKNSSIFKDKFDNPLSLLELKNGDIVDFSFDSGNKINYIQHNKDAFYLENITNLKIDIEKNTLYINNKIFNISSFVSVNKDGLSYDLNKISPLDVVSLKGYKSSIYFIDVIKGNGTLILQNKPNLYNATIEINRNIFKPLDQADNINLPEGKHKVVIRSNDISPFVKDIDITSGNETILDLSEIQNKSGSLLVTSNVSDYILYINDKIELNREPLNLLYGSYYIKVEKEGYVPFETQIYINKPKQTLNIKLEKLEKTGKLTINSSPTSAEVFVNNLFVGYTPLSYKLPQGTHSITIKKQGYNDFILSSVNITDEESSFNITLHKNTNANTTDTQTTTQNTTILEPVIP